MLITQPIPENRKITCLQDASLREFTVMLPKGHSVITANREIDSDRLCSGLKDGMVS